MDDEGALIQLEMQDRSKWDQDLIGRGFHHLDKASTGNELSEYHLEAGIAALHCAAPSYEKTEWAKILELYDALHGLKPSPIVALNAAIALGKALGPEEGLAQLSKVANSGRLNLYPSYSAAQGEFHLLAGRPTEAETHFEQALRLAREKAESSFFERKIQLCRLNAQ